VALRKLPPLPHMMALRILHCEHHFQSHHIRQSHTTNAINSTFFHSPFLNNGDNQCHLVLGQRDNDRFKYTARLSMSSSSSQMGYPHRRHCTRSQHQGNERYRICSKHQGLQLYKVRRDCLRGTVRAHLPVQLKSKSVQL